MRHETIAAPAPIHSAACSCFDCRLRDPAAFARHRWANRAWAMLFIVFLAVLYGTVISHLPQIAAAFGRGL